MNILRAYRQFLILSTIISISYLIYACSLFLIGTSISHQNSTKPPNSNSNSQSEEEEPPLAFKLNPITKTFELEGKPIIWQYWDSDDMPLYVRLLIEALQCRNPEFRSIVVHDSTIYDYLPDFRVPRRLYDILIPAHKADLFRVAVLARYGGFYANIDTFALEKLYPIYQVLSEYDLITPRYHNQIFTLTIGPTRSNLKIFQTWHENQLEIIKEKIPIDEDSSSNSSMPSENLLDSTDLLQYSMRGLRQIIDNETKYKSYDGLWTAYQLSRVDLQDSAIESFDELSHKFLPLRWSPVLTLFGTKLREAYGKVTELDELFPDKATLYSAFVGCALMDCRPMFEKLTEDVSPIAKANITELLNVLGRLDPMICEKINVRDGFKATVLMGLS